MQASSLRVLCSAVAEQLLDLSVRNAVSRPRARTSWEFECTPGCTLDSYMRPRVMCDRGKFTVRTTLSSEEPRCVDWSPNARKENLWNVQYLRPEMLAVSEYLCQNASFEFYFSTGRMPIVLRIARCALVRGRDQGLLRPRICSAFLRWSALGFRLITWEWYAVLDEFRLEYPRALVTGLMQT